MKQPLNITISGSYRKFPEAVAKDIEQFKDLGANVLSPASGIIIGGTKEFVLLEGDPLTNINTLSPETFPHIFRTIENSHLTAIQHSDALWLTLPTGYCGPATTFELGWALAHNIPVYTRTIDYTTATEPLLHAYVRPITTPTDLVEIPALTRVPKHTRKIMRRWIDHFQETPTFMNATIAVGAIIIDNSTIYTQPIDQEILLVKTHKWNGKYSIVGGSITRKEHLQKSLERHVQEQTGLVGTIGKLLCAFHMLPNSGYYNPQAERTYIDHAVTVNKRAIQLDDRAEEARWIAPKDALTELDIEPNARITIEHYLTSLKPAA
ncbi:MAG: NUDIX domain-containing protein [Nanoarchaeota archaeon]|nr:NUDIX domain-containing protein [Nanoarchaeota archaeon]